VPSKRHAILLTGANEVAKEVRATKNQRNKAHKIICRCNRWYFWKIPKNIECVRQLDVQSWHLMVRF
jgi:hypothetical protein